MWNTGRVQFGCGRALMSVKIFLSTVSDEFRLYRDQLGERDVSALVAKYSDLTRNLPPLSEPLKNGEGVSYTQWEAWLALYHDKDLFITQAAESAARGPRYAPTDVSRAAQTEHLKRLRELKRYPGFTFTSPVDLANYLKSTGILDLLVKAYAEESARARDVAEGFINEMAKKVAGDRSLDLKPRSKRFATRSISTKQRSPGDKHGPISTQSSMKLWRERGPWWRSASRV
jgi:hypothetical protein